MQQILLFRLLEQLLSDYETLLSLLERRWSIYPRGSLRTKIRGGTPYFTRQLSVQGRRTEIPIHLHTKDGWRLLLQLFEKRAVFHGRRVLRRNIKALTDALSKLKVYDPEENAGIDAFLFHSDPQHTEYEEDLIRKGLVLPDRVFLPGQLNTGKWIRDTLTGNYRTNPYSLEDLKHESSAGRWFRSKSEADWDDELTEAGALFRYDSEIRLKSGKVIYADFVVLLPAENRLVIIEHFGRMDDPRYAMKNMRRLQEYAESGYILGRDLFFTMETKASPLTRSQIRATMRQAGLLPIGAQGGS